MIARPLGKRVIIKPEEVFKSKSVIITPDTAKDQPMTGFVLALGTGIEKETGYALEVGHTVVFGKYAGHELELDGEKLLCVAASELLAVLSDD